MPRQLCERPWFAVTLAISAIFLKNSREALSECPGVADLPYSSVAEIANAIIALTRDASMKVLRAPSPISLRREVISHRSLMINSYRVSAFAGLTFLLLLDQYKNSHKPYQDLNLTALVTPWDVPHDLVRAVRKLARGGVEAGRVTNIEDRVRSFEALFIE